MVPEVDLWTLNVHAHMHTITHTHTHVNPGLGMNVSGEPSVHKALGFTFNSVEKENKKYKRSFHIVVFLPWIPKVDHSVDAHSEACFTYFLTAEFHVPNPRCRAASQTA